MPKFHLARHVSTRHDTFDVSSPCILAVSSLSNSTARHAGHDWLDTTSSTDSTGRTCRAHALWLCRVYQTARLDEPSGILAYAARTSKFVHFVNILLHLLVDVPRLPPGVQGFAPGPLPMDLFQRPSSSKPSLKNSSFRPGFCFTIFMTFIYLFIF